jgi:hypothetical protein
VAGARSLRYHWWERETVSFLRVGRSGIDKPPPPPVVLVGVGDSGAGRWVVVGVVRGEPTRTEDDGSAAFSLLLMAQSAIDAMLLPNLLFIILLLLCP